MSASGTEQEVEQADSKPEPYQRLTILIILLAILGAVVELMFNQDGNPSAWISLIEIVVVLGIGLSLSQIAGQDLLGVAAIYAGVGLAWGALALREQGWREIGLAQPDSWPRTLLLALAAALLGFFGQRFLQRVIYPRFDLGESDVSHVEDRLRGNLPTLLAFLLIGWFTAAFPEELLYRGFVMNWLSDLLGTAPLSWVVIVLLQSIIFGYIHAYQGMSGIISTGYAGLILGASYYLGGLNLWVPILAHGFLNSIAFVLLYLGVGREVTPSPEAPAG